MTNMAGNLTRCGDRQRTDTLVVSMGCSKEDKYMGPGAEWVSFAPPMAANHLEAVGPGGAGETGEKQSSLCFFLPGQVPFLLLISLGPQTLSS